jgi:hypothetical protein
LYSIHVPPVQPIRQTQERTEDPDNLAILRIEGSESFVLAFGLGATMIAGDIGHDQLFPFGQARQVGFSYEFVRSLVMTPIPFYIPNVVEQPRTVQQVPAIIIQAMEIGGSIKESYR